MELSLVQNWSMDVKNIACHRESEVRGYGFNELWLSSPNEAALPVEIVCRRS